MFKISEEVHIRCDITFISSLAVRKPEMYTKVRKSFLQIIIVQLTNSRNRQSAQNVVFSMTTNESKVHVLYMVLEQCMLPSCEYIKLTTAQALPSCE